MQIAARNVSGLVSHLAEDLDVDGYAVIHYDSMGRQVILNVERLRQGLENSRVMRNDPRHES